MSKRAIIYTRVSTDEQKENGFSLRDQESRLKKHCRREGIEVVGHYQDDHSAKNFNRPEFRRLLEDLKEKKVVAELFLCVRMDRFSRNLQESLKMIQTLKNYGLQFAVIEGGNFDLETPENLIPYVLNMLLPQVDNERRALNTKRGMRQARKEGRWAGTPPNGYRWQREGGISLLVPNEKAKLVVEAFEEFGKGVYTMEEVRRKLNKKGLKSSRNQFTKLLRNPVYIGHIRIEAWKDEPAEIVKGLHEPLISEELFSTVQDILSGRKRKIKTRSTRDERLPLRGFLQCRLCDGHITGSASKSRTGAKHYYYHCQHGCKERFRADEANDHFLSYLRSFEIREEVVTLYYHIMEDVFKKDDAGRENEIKAIEKQIQQAHSSIDKADDKFIEGQIDDETYNRISERYKARIQELTIQKAELEEKESNFMQYVNYGFSLLENLDAYYLEAEIAVRQKLIGSIFPGKLVYDEKNYRTTQINQVLSLLTSNINDLGAVEKEKAVDFDGLSYRASPRGVEPLLQE